MRSGGSDADILICQFLFVCFLCFVFQTLLHTLVMIFDDDHIDDFETLSHAFGSGFLDRPDITAPVDWA